MSIASMQFSTPTLKLYELPNAYQVIDYLLDESGGEITEQIQELFDQLEGTLAEKGEYLAKTILSAQRRAEAYKAEAKRLAELAERADTTATNVKAVVKKLMEAVGCQRFETTIGPIKIQKNGGNQKIEWLGDLADAPADFVEFVPRLLTDKVQRLFKSDGELPRQTSDPQAATGFYVHPRGTHVRIG